MIEHDVHRPAMDQIIHHIAQIVGQGQYTLADVTLALAEFSGRMIVSACDTPISGIQMAQVFEDHIKRTLEAGYIAKGYNMSGGLNG